MCQSFVDEWRLGASPIPQYSHDARGGMCIGVPCSCFLRSSRRRDNPKKRAAILREGGIVAEGSCGGADGGHVAIAAPSPVCIHVVCHVNACGVVSQCLLHYLTPLYSPVLKEQKGWPGVGVVWEEVTAFVSSRTMVPASRKEGLELRWCGRRPLRSWHRE